MLTFKQGRGSVMLWALKRIEQGSLRILFRQVLQQAAEIMHVVN